MCVPFLKSSVGQKAVVAVTGLVLFGFVVAHMLGNLQIFLGAEALNAYAKKLQNMPLLLWPARLFLLLTLLIHVFVSLKLAIENRKARPIPYVSKNTVQATAASRTMVFSGLAIFGFIVYHLLHFTFGVTHPGFFHLTDARGYHDVYSMVVLSFQDIWVSASYIAAMAFLCLHLSHGLASFPQSLGFNRESWIPGLKCAARAVALIIFIGNSSIPLAALLGWVVPA
jgi:succinate dehydrogenase / fumarate reductase cytochrome b subunit